MSDFVDDIINVEIVSHRDAISRRSDSASFDSVDANTADTAGVSAAAGSAEHVANVVIRLADICS